MNDWILIKLQRNTGVRTSMRPCIRNCRVKMKPTKSGLWVCIWIILLLSQKFFNPRPWFTVCMFVYLRCVIAPFFKGFLQKICAAQFCRSSYHCKHFLSLCISLMTILCFIHIVDVNSFVMYYKCHKLSQHFPNSDYHSSRFSRWNVVQPLAVV